MAHHTESIGLSALSRATWPPIGRGAGLDWAMIVLSGWLLGGLYLDG